MSRLICPFIADEARLQNFLTLISPIVSCSGVGVAAVVEAIAIFQKVHQGSALKSDAKYWTVYNRLREQSRRIVLRVDSEHGVKGALLVLHQLLQKSSNFSNANEISVVCTCPH